MHTFEPSLSDGKRTLEWLFPRSGTVFEIRVLLKGSNRARSGYFNDHAAALKAIEREDTKSGVSGIFVTLNPCDTRLLNRCCNRLQDAASGTLTKNNEIVRRENVLIDGDAIRPAGISATDGERKAAIERIREVGAWLRELGAGDILLGDSGNGGHALLAIDLDVGADTDALCEGVLKAICALWSDDRVKIDTSVATRARLTKIFGTVARKGDDTRDRPHRRSRILHDPSQRRLTGRAVLEKIATMAPVIESPSRSGRPSSFDLDRFITANCIRILREVPWADGRKLELAQCPFVTDHDSRYHPAIFETARGLGFHCFGDRCSGKTWSDLRALFEPSYRGRDERDGEDQQTAAGTENERPRFLPIAEFLARRTTISWAT